MLLKARLDINEDHLNENTQRLFIRSLLQFQQGDRPPSRGFSRDSGAGRRVGMLSRDARKAPACPALRGSAWAAVHMG